MEVKINEKQKKSKPENTASGFPVNMLTNKLIKNKLIKNLNSHKMMQKYSSNNFFFKLYNEDHVLQIELTIYQIYS